MDSASAHMLPWHLEVFREEKNSGARSSFFWCLPRGRLGASVQPETARSHQTGPTRRPLKYFVTAPPTNCVAASRSSASWGSLVTLVPHLVLSNLKVSSWLKSLTISACDRFQYYLEHSQRQNLANTIPRLVRTAQVIATPVCLGVSSYFADAVRMRFLL